MLSNKHMKVNIKNILNSSQNVERISNCHNSFVFPCAKISIWYTFAKTKRPFYVNSHFVFIPLQDDHAMQETVCENGALHSNLFRTGQFLPAHLLPPFQFGQKLLYMHPTFFRYFPAAHMQLYQCCFHHPILRLCHKSVRAAQQPPDSPFVRFRILKRLSPSYPYLFPYPFFLLCSYLCPFSYPFSYPSCQWSHHRS